MQNCDVCGGKRWYSHVDKKTGLQRRHHIKVGELEYDLRVWRCFRCNHVQEDEIPFVPTPQRRGRANILYIDLEVSKSAAYTYGLRVPSKYIAAENLFLEYFIICWSASYVGSSTVWGDCVTPAEVVDWRNGSKTPDGRILARLQELIASADIVAGHNVDAYDVRRANTRFLLNKLEPIVGKKTHDTLKIARRKFAFESNTLDYISQRLGLRPKDHIDNRDWLKIVSTGDEKTLSKVMKYNKGDVKNGKGILEQLMKYSGKKEWFGSVTLEGPVTWLKNTKGN